MNKKSKHGIFILKIHSGIHENATITLEEKEYFIGSHDSNDIVLQDKDIFSKHGILKIENNKIFIQPMEGTISVNNNYINNMTQIKLGDIVGFNKIFASFHDINKNIPKIDINKVLFKFKKSSTNPKKDNYNIQNFDKNLVFNYFTAGAFILFITFSFILNFINIDNNYKINVTTDSVHDYDLLDKLRSDISKISKEVNVSIDLKNNNLIIDGYVLNNHNKQKIIKLVSAIQLPKNVKLYIINNIISMVNNTINAAGYYDIGVLYSDLGQITLNGLVDHENDILVIKNLIMSDVLGVKKIINNLIPIKNLSKIIKNVSIGKNPYVSTNDNKKKFVGSQLISGITIADINDQTLVLKYQDKMIIYNFINNTVINSI